ncbi:MAG: tetratricopeptide repeat protein [Flavobacteriales bacterium]|nr:tetratricopeptide repeat protein [Flavobacteriales bacterium]
MTRLFFLICLLSFPLCSMAQDAKLDSLWAVWNNKTEADTSRMNALLEVVRTNYSASKRDSMFYHSELVYRLAKSRGDKKNMANALKLQGLALKVKGETDSAFTYVERAFELFREADNKKSMGACLIDLGQILQSKGEYDKALEQYMKALEIVEASGEKYLIGNTYNSIGIVYKYQGNYPKAIENLLVALRIKEEIGDKRGIAACYNNIAVIHQDQGNYEQSLQTHQRSLEIREEIGDKRGTAMAYANMGNVFILQKQYDKGLENTLKALRIAEEVGDKYGIANCNMNVAVCYNKLGNYGKSLQHTKLTLNMFEEMGIQWGVAASYANMGSTYNLMKKPAEGRKWYSKSLALSRELGTKDQIKQSYLGLAESDSALHDYKGAYENYKMYLVYRDSLVNEENTKKTTQLEMQYEFDKKEAATQAEQDKKDAIAAEELRRKNLQRNASIGGLALMVLLASVFFVQRNRIGKEKARSEELLLNILPEEVATELKEKGHADAKLIDDVTVLFTDFKGFTAMSENLSPQQLVEDLNVCFSAFDHIMEKHGLEKIKTIGDAYMAAGGLPTPNSTHASDVVKAAFEMRDFVEQGKAKKVAAGLPYFEIRIGVHTGPVVAGIVGVKKFQYDIWGDTVNTASRMESSGEAGKVNISQSTYHLVKGLSEFAFVSRGEVEAKGKGKLKMYFVEIAS